MTGPFAEDLQLEARDIARLLSGAGGESGRLRLDPETIESDLARIVLGLMEFLRQLMELQAIRRMENGSLTEAEEDRLGETLMRAEAAIGKLADQFGLSPADLSLDLGPLGRTI
ncbi:gas vesicle protein K [Rhodobacterales bacterium HKCCE3408]|nr:gas vesicle protein K [Rhodobacterales bacterium HKCCE3408]